MPRRTVARPAELGGIGLFSGSPCAITVAPADPGRGVRFHSGNVSIPAIAAQRVAAPRRTALSSGPARVDTVEHFLAAVAALGLDDLDVAVSGGEIPVADGSFAPFVRLLQAAGTTETSGVRHRVSVDQVVDLDVGESRYRVEPADRLQVDVTLEYAQPVIGRQRFTGVITADFFAREIAPARTFGFLAEIERAQRHGELLGAVDGSGIALDADRVLNTTLRWRDEFVRHKTGDLLGDLALIAAPLAARITTVRPSHEGNFACVQAILGAARFLEE